MHPSFENEMALRRFPERDLCPLAIGGATHPVATRGLVKQGEIQQIANRATFLPIPKLSGIVNPAPRLIADDAMRFMEELVSADFGREREPSIAQRIAIGIARQLAMLIAGLLLQFQDLSPKLDGKWRYPPTRLSRNRRALRVHQTAPGLPAGPRAMLCRFVIKTKLHKCSRDKCSRLDFVA